MQLWALPAMVTALGAPLGSTVPQTEVRASPVRGGSLQVILRMPAVPVLLDSFQVQVALFVRIVPQETTPIVALIRVNHVQPGNTRLMLHQRVGCAFQDSTRVPALPSACSALPGSILMTMQRRVLHVQLDSMRTLTTQPASPLSLMYREYRSTR